MRHFILALAALGASAVTLCAQTGPRVVQLSLAPARPPTPALKYHLLPWVSEMRPGNAAVFYERAINHEWLHAVTRSDNYAQLTDWLEQPLTRDLAAKLEPFGRSLAVREFDVAARCEYVDWQLTGRLRDDSFSMLLPDVQQFRILATLLAARTRVEIQQGKFDDACRSLQTGFALGRHLNEAPILINTLVGVAASNLMLNRLEELIQAPGMANLYWALTDLPDPLVDLRRGLQGERLMVEGLLPEITAALHDPRLPVVPAELIRERVDKVSSLVNLGAPRLALAAMAAFSYPQARQNLIDQGHAAAQVDALPVTQVVLMNEMLQYQRWIDALTKVYGLPYYQARPFLARLRDELQETKRLDSQGSMLAKLLVPALDRIMLAQVRTQRRVAMLRTVEALRLHAAEHGGKLPESLEDVRAVPIPIDPMTGRTFHYQRPEAGRATLEAHAPPGEGTNEGSAVRYEITLTPRP
jgi:hypothetical protein